MKLRKTLTSLVVTLAAYAGFLTSANAVTISKPKGVVELFTSQGCYSCPAADKVIGKFSEGTEILGLSWHVDYWDYLGWKDTFANPQNTERQYKYARILGERQVYTPQAIINGREHSIGSHEKKIRTLVGQFAQSNKGMTVPINVSMEDDSLSIMIDKGAIEDSATLYMVFFSKTQTVNIGRGENGGKSLAYHNVVHKSQPLGLVKNDGIDMGYPKLEISQEVSDSCALILQTIDADGNPGAIIGATVISDW